MASGSALFPFEEDSYKQSLRRADTVNKVLKSSIACFLLTSPGQRRGNPIGSFLPSLKHNLIPSSSIPSIESELNKELTNQFPGVVFSQTSITQDAEDQVINLKVKIVFSTAVTEVEELSVLI